MEKYRSFEQEVTVQGTHHVHQIKGNTRDMVELAIRENYQLLDEMEPGMNLGAFPFGYTPTNTLR